MKEIHNTWSLTSREFFSSNRSQIVWLVNNNVQNKYLEGTHRASSVHNWNIVSITIFITSVVYKVCFLALKLCQNSHYISLHSCWSYPDGWSTGHNHTRGEFPFHPEQQTPRYSWRCSAGQSPLRCLVRRPRCARWVCLSSDANHEPSIIRPCPISQSMDYPSKHPSE